MFRTIRVNSKEELKAFIDFPHTLYRHDKNYVPEMDIPQMRMLTRDLFRQHSSVQFFLAVDDHNKIAGRIAAIRNNTDQYPTYPDNDGLFGLFDCINDADAANCLLKEACSWLQLNGATVITGPVNFASRQATGILISGFEYPPAVSMPYNAPYYPSLLQQAGFCKKQDLHAYRWDDLFYNGTPLLQTERLTRRLAQKEVVIRKISTTGMKKEVAGIQQVYNRTLPQPASIKSILAEITDPDFCFVAEQAGQIVGFVLGMPDRYQLFRLLKKGRLFPAEMLKLCCAKKVKGLRIHALAILEGYRKRGIETCLYAGMVNAYLQKNMQYAETSLVPEDHLLLRNAISALGGKQNKTYRIYTRRIT
jgi:ribosomal protein S18 acetylase RimI-like enzyme